MCNRLPLLVDEYPMIQMKDRHNVVNCVMNRSNIIQSQFVNSEAHDSCVNRCNIQNNCSIYDNFKGVLTWMQFTVCIGGLHICSRLESSVLRSSRVLQSNVSESDITDSKIVRSRIEGSDIEGCYIRGLNLEYLRLQHVAWWVDVP